MRERCQGVAAYVNRVFGPYVQRVLNRVNEFEQSSGAQLSLTLPQKGVPAICVIRAVVACCATGDGSDFRGTAASHGRAQSSLAFVWRTIFTGNIAIRRGRLTDQIQKLINASVGCDQREAVSDRILKSGSILVLSA